MKKIFILTILMLFLIGCVSTMEKFHRNGMKKSEGLFGWGETGVWTYYYDNGQIEKQGAYKSGLETGEWFYYYSDGKLESQKNYKRGKTHGLSVQYTKDGKITSEVNYKNGMYDGFYIVYFDNNKFAKEEGNYKKNQKDGKWISIKKERKHYNSYTYYYNKEEGNYKNNQKDGKWLYYHPCEALEELERPSLSKEVIYQNGKADGNLISYYTNGQIERIEIFTDTKKDGKWLSYYSDGQLKEEINYTNGLLTGDWIEYDKDGALLKKNYYEKGRLIQYKYDNNAKTN